MNDILKYEKNETLLRQDALGALQKFSLRRRPQDIMIQLDVIQWLVYTINLELYSMSDYSLEYTTALLMNLSLRTKGKDKCEENIENILDLLFKMLDHKNEQVRTYINGILYSVLSRKSIKIVAKNMNLEHELDSLTENAEDRFYRQYTYIKTQLTDMNSVEQKSEINDEDNDDNFEDDETDEEIGIEDEDLSQFGVEVGENLLNKF